METLVSGIQPSGELHIGNYIGAVRNWVRYQNKYESYFIIVDLHAITVPYNPEELPEKVFDMAVGLLASGIDPKKAALFVQSQVPWHTYLGWLFNTITPLGDLQRMTQYKDKARRGGFSIMAGLFDYPVLQAADIALYKGVQVPVGIDQVQHIELSREIVRKFNKTFGNTFPEPKALLSEVPKIKGLDGKAKMSKSLKNHIGLLESKDEIWKKLRPAVTDPARVRKTDPGTPEKCNIFSMHKAFSSNDVIQEVHKGCTTGTIGCIDCKKALLKEMDRELEPIREKANELKQNRDLVIDILLDGQKRALQKATLTIEEVNKKMGLGGIDK